MNFVREAAVYRFLKYHSFCKDKTIPDFFGVIYNVRQPQHWPTLDVFEAPRPANAIILEYVKDMESLSVENYTEARGERIKSIAERYNQLGVRHGDPYPRNMQLVVGKDGKDDRLLWIDFETSELLHPVPSEQYQKDWLREDLGCMKIYLKEVANDYNYAKALAE